MRQKIAVIAAMIFGISFSLYGNCRDKIQPLLSTTTSVEYKPTKQKIEIITKMSNIFQKLT